MEPATLDGVYLDENVSERLAVRLRSLGYDVATTAERGRKGTSDVNQLSYAARGRRIFVAYDTGHYEMLHEAWQMWSRYWGVADRVRHAGILFLPYPGLLPVSDAARAVGELLARREGVENGPFVRTIGAGWREIVVDA